MNSFNSEVFLVSSFQNLIQSSMVNHQQESNNIPNLRPIRKLSPQSSSQIISPQLSPNAININNNIKTSIAPSQCFEQRKNHRLRSDDLSIDFNIFKRTIRGQKTTCCSFCLNNGEPDHVYMSHPFKDLKGVVVCPILQNHICPICGESGDKAHTITYCKKYKDVKRNRILNNIN